MRIAIIGAGIVGSAIAYELSEVSGLDIHVFDQRSVQAWYSPGTATGAALGILIAVGSTKQQSPLLELRLASLQRYETLIPELEALTGHSIPYNRQGVLDLCFDSTAWTKWQRIAQTRQQQGLNLSLLSPDQVGQIYPHLRTAQSLGNATPLQGGVYSPQDRQVDPIALTQALIAASQQRGVQFHFQTPAVPLQPLPREPAHPEHSFAVSQLQTSSGQRWDINALVIAAGTGSHGLTQDLGSPVAIEPVVGQALHLRCEQPWCSAASPVIQGADVHLVPLRPDVSSTNDAQELWVGATVELSVNGATAPPSSISLDQVYRQAIALCPALQTATVLRQWVGWRPRPQARPAPVIEPLAGYRNVWLATGHYRNGVLLAPITGLKIKQNLTQLQGV